MAGIGKWGVRVCALSVAVATVLLAPSGAAGATSWQTGDFKYVKDTGFMPAAGSTETKAGDVKIACGQGWDIVSGGADSKGLPGHGWLSGSGFGGSRHWFVEASHLDEAKTKMLGWATCLRERDTETSTHVEGITAGPISEGASVECPDSLAVLGGGVRTTGEATSWVINSLAPIDTADMDMTRDDGWQAYMGYGGAATANFLVDVTCGEDLPQYVSKSVDLPVSIEGVRAKMKCPAGTHVTGGGGFLSGNSLEARQLATKPIDLKDKDKAPDDGWHVRAANSEGAMKTLTVHAICA